MPPAARRPPPAPARQLQFTQRQFADPSSDLGQSDLGTDADEEDLIEDIMEEMGDEDQEEQTQEQLDSHPEPQAPPLPPNLREISSLASWTVSSSKPGCSVPQLRSPNTNLFWQSDGPQPHLLNIHFFKMVSIIGMRLYLDFEADESYTPTRIVFAAGTGQHDLQEWADIRLEQPTGWVNIDFEGVGRIEDSGDNIGEDSEDEGGDGDDSDDGSGSNEEDDSDDDLDIDNPELNNPNNPDISPETRNRLRKKIRRRKRRQRRHNVRMPVLRAMLVQVRIMENHQNGKDTHLRGLQIFARDKTRLRAAAEAAALAVDAFAEVDTATTTKSLSSIGSKRKKKSFMMPGAEVPELR